MTGSFTAKFDVTRTPDFERNQGFVILAIFELVLLNHYLG